MKKMMFFLMMVAIVTSQVVFGQTGMPCAVLDQNRDIDGMREIVMKDGAYYENLRSSYAEAINYSIGKKVVTGSKYNMDYILENTILVDADFVVASDYLNGVRYGNLIKFTNLTGQPSDKWAAFRYEGVDHIYAKISCMNAQKIKIPGVYNEQEKTKTAQNDEKETPNSNGLPKDIGGSQKEVVEEKGCLIESFVASPDTIRKGQKSFLLWEVSNASYVKISGINTNLKLTDNMEVHPLFKGRQKSVMYTLEVYKDDVLCKTQKVFVYKQDNPWLFKKIPNWLEATMGTAIITGVVGGFVFPGDGVWYGLGGKNPIIAEAEFNPVDALPQARLPQKKGFNPNLTFNFRF